MISESDLAEIEKRPIGETFRFATESGAGSRSLTVSVSPEERDALVGEVRRLRTALAALDAIGEALHEESKRSRPSLAPVWAAYRLVTHKIAQIGEGTDAGDLPSI